MHIRGLGPIIILLALVAVYHLRLKVGHKGIDGLFGVIRVLSQSIYNLVTIDLVRNAHVR